MSQPYLQPSPFAMEAQLAGARLSSRFLTGLTRMPALLSVIELVSIA